MKSRLLLMALLVIAPFLLGNGGEVASTEITGNPYPILSWPPDGWTVDTLTPSLRWQSEGYSQIVVMPKGSSVPVVDVVLPKGQDSYTVATPLAPATAYRWKVRNNPYAPAQSVYTWSAWSPEGTFTTPGGTSWADTATVRPMSPPNGALTSLITPTLSWTAPAGSTYYQMVITQEGSPAGTVRFVNRISSTYVIPGPPSWYGMMPDTRYSWRVRVTNSPAPVPDDHPSWGPWSETWSFQTPIPSSDLILPVSPAPGSASDSATPTLMWKNGNDQVFYYEVQVSRDPNFVTTPGAASAPVYWEVRHGGMTTPLNSYTISSAYPLERGQVYYWRVRPALPHAAQAAPWSTAWTFTVK